MGECGSQQVSGYHQVHHSMWQTQVTEVEAFRHVLEVDVPIPRLFGELCELVGSVKREKLPWTELVASHSN